MRKLIPIILILLILATTGTALASVITGALWSGIIRATNTDTLESHVSCNVSINTQALIDAGFINASTNNTAVQNTSGADIAFMPGYNAVNSTMPWCFWIDSIPADAQQNHILYTGGGDMDGKQRYFPAMGGMVTDDDPGGSLEFSDNFTYEIAGWVNTDNATDKNLYYKGDAFGVFVSPTVSENITARIYGGDDNLNFVAASAVQINDHADFSFVTAPTVDTSFSITSWINADDMTSGTWVSKSIAAAFEWRIYTAADDTLWCSLYAPGGAADAIEQFSAALTAYENQWIHFGVTYDGSEAAAGIELYLNGEPLASTPNSPGAYVGMTDGAAKVNIGSWNDGTADFFDGDIAEVKIWKTRVLTPAEILADYEGNISVASMVGWWKFDEGIGLPQDSSGNAHHATANNADWVNNFDFDYRIAASVTATDVVSDEHIVTVEQANNTAGGWLAGWDKRIRIDVDADKVDGDLTFFPVLVKLSSSSGIGADDTTVVFDELGANSLKIAVTQADGTTEMYVDIEKWDEVAEEAWIWTSIAGWVIDDTVDTTLYLYFDNDHADNAAFVGASGSVVAQSVWDANFKLVDHLQDNAANTTFDSTSNNVDGLKKGNNEPIETTGYIGDAQDFDNLDDFIDYGAAGPQAMADTDPFTLEWIINTPDSTFNTLIGSTFGFYRILLHSADTVRWHDGLDYQIVGYLGSFINQRVQLTVTADAGRLVKTYRDGTLVAGERVIATTEMDLRYLGTQSNLANFYDGMIDEYRVSDVVRAAEWIKATSSTNLDDFVTFVPFNADHMEMLPYDFRIYIEGVEQDRQIGAAVPDNANDIYQVQNGSMPYMEYSKTWIDGVLQQHIKWEYSDVFTDLSGEGHDATPTFRSVCSDPDISAILASFSPIAEAQAPAWVLGAAPDFWDTENVTATSDFSTTITPTFPGKEVVDAIAAASDTPTQLPYTLIIGFVILALSVTTSWFMAKHGEKNLWIKLLVITVIMGFAVAVRMFDFWMLLFFLIMAIAIIMFSRRRTA